MCRGGGLWVRRPERVSAWSPLAPGLFGCVPDQDPLALPKFETGGLRRFALL